MVSLVSEVVSSIRVVKAFSREDYEIRRFEGESLEAVEAALAARSLKARLVPIVNIVTAIGTCAVLWFGAQLAMSGRLAPGSMVVFIFYLGKMYKPMQDISKTIDAYSKAATGFERIQEILRSDDEVHDEPNARKAPPFKGQIEFEHVEFSYKESEPVLTDVNMHIEPGTMVALVGPTGAGKTTVINLIARFYDPTSGVVKIDGTDIREFTQKSLRSQISFVLQDTVLFSGTIWDNIAYGCPDATEAQIVKAAETANAMEFIEKLPQKFDTAVGERGVTLSGGQRQRIAIARAIIRKTPILILDEPTSGLDAASEQLVVEALDRLMEGKTSIVIAHRLSTVRRASCIFVIENGVIAESGTHDELLQRKDGVYKKLHDIQASLDEAPAEVVCLMQTHKRAEFLDTLLNDSQHIRRFHPAENDLRGTRPPVADGSVVSAANQSIARRRWGFPCQSTPDRAASDIALHSRPAPATGAAGVAKSIAVSVWCVMNFDF